MPFATRGWVMASWSLDGQSGWRPAASGDVAVGDSGAGFAEVRAVLRLAPWSGEPLNAAKPDGPVRTMVFGVERRGLVTYLVLEGRRRVDLLDVVWLG